MTAKKPDEIIHQGSAVPAKRVVWKEMALAVPNLVKLLARLARDPRVPVRSKTFAGFMAAYLVSPIDIVPDFIPFLGKTDDLVLVAFALNHMIQTAGYDVVKEHWDGEEDVLDMVVDVVDFVAGLVPRAIRVGLNRVLRG
jgi:uncharacterized membrane protein YkvA (DUF1232 family)